MKIRKFGFVLLTISLIMIISGGVSSFLIGLRADKELTYKRMEDVSLIFEDFSTTITLFEEKRDELYGSVLSNVYYDAMLQNDATFRNSLSNYEAMVDEIGKQVVSLDTLCDDVYYPDGEINSKCNNYKSIYEQVVNYFVSDIKVYNENIAKFNQYQAGLNSTVRLNEYATTKDYIDYNNDKQYDGKEEE